MSDLTRRSFLALAAGATAGSAAAASVVPQAAATHAEPVCTNPTSTEISLEEPADFQPDLVLDCGFILKTIDGVKVKLRAYNGMIPGPLIDTRAGRTLRIRMKNSLPAADSTGWDGNMDVPHMFGHVNLHLHGLDVPPHIFEPLGTSNPLAPMISIPPGGQKDYPFVIPDDQPPGLNWYHPHSHGSTTVQAVSGLAGGLIIRGAIDEVPEIKAAKDNIMVVQDIGLFETNEPHADYTDSFEPKQNAIWQTYSPGEGEVTIDNKPTNLHCGFTTGDYHLRYYLLNGEPFFREKHNPVPPEGDEQPAPIPHQFPPFVYKMRPGEVARFRILNGCSDLMMPLMVEGQDLWLLAMDGNNFASPQLRPASRFGAQVLLGPANRAEFLIKANPKPGKYRILQLKQSEQFLAAPEKVIAVIEVEGEPINMELPEHLPKNKRDPPIRSEEIKRKRYFVFSSTFPGVQNPVVGIDFQINNQLYDELAVPTVTTVNECEEWHIMVPNSQEGGTEGHPFHIHVNSFEVKSIAGVPQMPGLIQDTIWVPQNTAAVIWMRFKEWSGKSVFHCHILPHEDTGMMQNFLILDKRPNHHYSME
jgi:suppressor of ftsI